jgi:dTDP-glucose pyrophosphorylase
MVPIAGRPMIDRVLAALRSARVERLIVVGHPGDRRLGDFLRTDAPDVALALQPERRGSADALCRALPLIENEAYLACSCDSLFRAADLTEFIERGRAYPSYAVVGVLEMSAADTRTRSGVRLDGERVVEIVEKPAPGTGASGLVGAPLYWLPRAFDSAVRAEQGREGGESYVSTALNRFIGRGETVLALKLADRIEITTAADVARAEAALRTWQVR